MSRMRPRRKERRSLQKFVQSSAVMWSKKLLLPIHDAILAIHLAPGVLGWKSTQLFLYARKTRPSHRMSSFSSPGCGV